ncbi:hypothetical protein HK104_006588 [Borealophlyctis nickersoniae]|nr:hypothetical protein HK104_006588 [Borealophlyctis nickersoniae]
MTTDGTHPAPSPTKPAVYKHRTKKAYLDAVAKFKSDMEAVSIALALSVVFSLTTPVEFNDRQGWALYLASAQLVAIPVWCALIYVSYRAVMRNKGGDEVIIKILYGVIFLCLTLQGVLAYRDPKDSFWGFLHMCTGFIGFVGAMVMANEAAKWFHNEFWNPTQADVLRELPE